MLPVLIRIFERLLNYLFGKMLLTVFSVNTVRTSYHPDHKDFDFIKNERGELRVKDVIRRGDVLLCNQVSLLDFIFLEMNYSPIFTAVCFDGKRYGLRRIGMFELPFYAMGVKFPRTVSDGQLITDIEAVRGYVSQRPIVIFPEGSKTNGRGILAFEEDIVEMILAASEKKMRIHTVRFDYGYEFVSPYNTTDVFGFWTLARLITQVR